VMVMVRVMVRVSVWSNVRVCLVNGDLFGDFFDDHDAVAWNGRDDVQEG